jgi:tetratricopeptide (TPR) repeat protein
MTFWDFANGQPTDLTPIKDVSVAKAVAEPVFGATVGAAFTVGFAYALVTGNYPIFPGLLGVRESYKAASESVRRGIPQALANLEESKRRVALARIEQAIRYYERVLDVKPNDSAMLKRVALSYAAKGDTSAALSSIEKAVKTAPDDHQGWLIKGTFCLTFGDLAGARNSFEKAAECGPHDPESWSNLGLVYQQLGDNEKARLCWENVNGLTPGDFSAWINRGELAYLLGMVEEGVKAWKAACAINSSLTPIWIAGFEAGSLAFSKGDIAAASAYYDKAIHLNPNYSEPWIGKALCAKTAANSDQALQFLDEALKRDRANARAWLIRGTLLVDSKREEEAQAAWKLAYSIDNSMGVPWVVAYKDGCEFLASNQLQEAIHSFAAAVELFPAYTDAWFKMGVAYRPLGRTEYARRCWLRVLECDSRHGLALMNLGNLEFVDGHRDRALELWSQAIDADPKLTQAAMNKGAVLADIGELRDATELFSRAASAGHPLGSQALDLCRAYDEMDPSVGPLA